MVGQPENVAFIPNAAARKRLPDRDSPHSDIDRWISQIESPYYDTRSLAQGNVGSKLDATYTRVFMLQLRDPVLRGLQAGEKTDELGAPSPRTPTKIGVYMPSSTN